MILDARIWMIQDRNVNSDDDSERDIAGGEDELEDHDMSGFREDEPPRMSVGKPEPDVLDPSYFTLPQTFHLDPGRVEEIQVDPSRFQVESDWNGRNGRNLVGMKCQ